MHRMVALALALVLAAAPAHADDSPRAIAEAGLAAFHRHDLVKAEALTRDAIAKAASDDATRGAALYNLGVILEAKGDRAGAIGAYRESVTARPNAAVRDHLRTLDRAAAEAVDALVPQTMAGPFPTLDAYHPSEPPRRAFTAVGPIQDVRTLVLPDNGGHGIAIKLAAGWYVGPLGTFEDLSHCNVERFALDNAVPRTVPGATVLQVTYTASGSCSHRDDDWSWNEQTFAVVGVGPSGAPMVTPSIELAILETDGHTNKKTMDYVRTATWGADGVLTVASKRAWGTTGGPSGELQQPVLGKHSFPFK